MSSGQQKRRRSSSSSRRRCDAVGDVNRNDLNEDDEEDERAIHGTDKNKRRSELLQDDATAAAGPVAAAAEATSSNGTLTTHGGGRSPSNKWELTPISILLRTMSYMDNATLRYCVWSVNKSAILFGVGKEWKPTLSVSLDYLHQKIATLMMVNCVHVDLYPT